MKAKDGVVETITILSLNTIAVIPQREVTGETEDGRGHPPATDIAIEIGGGPDHPPPTDIAIEIGGGPGHPPETDMTVEIEEDNE